MEQLESVLKFYRSVVSDEFVKQIQSSLGLVRRGSVFGSAVVSWLMILQRLGGGETLTTAVHRVRNGSLEGVVDPRSIRIRGGKISGSTSGYSQARNREPVEVVDSIADALTAAMNALRDNGRGTGQRVYLIDGTTIRLAHTSANIEKYPQYKNQFGKAHFPLMRLVWATDADSGIAQRPSFGPYNGAHPTSELFLAESVLPRLERGSIVIGDRYFGCVRFVSLALQHGLHAICRIKELNARRYIGDQKTPTGELLTTWESKGSRDGKSYSVSGRFIWHTFKSRGMRTMKIVLFTTSDLPLAQVVELYAKRWLIESDFRDIKSTLECGFITAKTPQMIAKEIVLGVVAFNLVRLFMTAAAKTIRTSPRNLSFAATLSRIIATSDVGFDDISSLSAQRALKFLLIDAKYLKLPSRKKQRPKEPRKVWQHGHYCFMSKSRQEERDKLNILK